MKAVVHQHGIDDLERSPEMHEFVYRQAQNAAVHALYLAPHRLGYYKRAMFARRGSEGFIHAFASASYGSDDFKAWWIEWGTRRGMKAHHVLLRTAIEMGFDVRRVNNRGR